MLFQGLSFFLLSIPLAIMDTTIAEKSRRVQAHLLIDDTNSAVREAEEFAFVYPDSKEAKTSLILALAASGCEDRALEMWHDLSLQDPLLAMDRNLLEELGWGFLKKSMNSTQFSVRLSALIGAFLTQDAKAVPYIVKMMKDSNAVVRSVAAQMASQYGDAALKDEIHRLLTEEKVWMVRLSLIQACGHLRMKEETQTLEKIIKSEKTTYEERLCAIESLCHMYDHITLAQWKVFAKSNRAGLRHFACNAAAHFKLESAKDDILLLLQDTHPDVKIAALNALGLFYRHELSREQIEMALKPLLQDSNPLVSITALWAATISDLDVLEGFKEWIFGACSENRRLASTALAATGSKGVLLAKQVIQESQDPYVKANLSLGLIGQRQETDVSCTILHQFLSTEKRMLMLDSRQNPLFEVLSPSQVRHIDHIPNYPETVDHMTRLSLLSTLTLADDPNALEFVKQFLKKKSWGVSGYAAATLLQEGDDGALEIVKQLADDPDPDVRLQACFVLAMYGRDETVVQELQKAYAGSTHERKLNILEAMGRIGHVENFHFLISALNEPFPILKVAAAASLIQSIHR